MARLTDAQLADRRNHLGASDIAVLAGVSPYATPFELYLEKIGELDPDAKRTDADRERMERGHRLEDVALDWDADIRGLSIERIRRDIVHPRLPFIVVHPDARVKPWRQTRRLLEAKTSARKWDVVPQHIEAQVQAQMAATGADVADIVVLGFDGPPTVFEVPRNEELIAGLEDLASSFWDRVQRRDPPPMDGSRATSRWLDRLFREGPEEVADASQADAIARLLAIRAQAKALEVEDGELVNALKFSMAGGSRLYAPQVGRITWTAPAERRTTAWKDVVAEIRAWLVDDLPAWYLVAALDAAEAAHTTVAEGLRTFRVTPAKPEAD
ncbi:MAG: YqaJ viral recombinase family protein [Actinomycetes bacterium]